MLAAFTDFERREDVSEKLKSLSLSSSSSLLLLFSPFSEFSLLWIFLAHLGGEFFSSWERTTMSSSPSSSTLLGLSRWVCISERTTLWLILMPLDRNFCFLCRNETFTHLFFGEIQKLFLIFKIHELERWKERGSVNNSERGVKPHEPKSTTTATTTCQQQKNVEITKSYFKMQKSPSCFPMSGGWSQ